MMSPDENDIGPVTVGEEPRPPAELIALPRLISQDTGPALASETRDLLHHRLRAASFMLAVGFGAFLLRDLWITRFLKDLIYLHALVFATLLVNIAALSGRWRPNLRQLRRMESAIFAMIVAFFVLGQYFGMRQQARLPDVQPWVLAAAVKSSIIGMLTVIFTYAIFIPNDWRRAFRIITPMALAPLVVPLILGLTTPEFRDVYEGGVALNFENLSEHALLMALGAITAIWGTHTINTFRTEAFRARRLNQYQLKEKLGAGGMGEVFLAEHHLLKRPCALKLIRPGLSQKPRALARFELEVTATARLSHWNTVEVYDYGRTEDGTFYYVMEYLPGSSLQDLVEKHGPMPASRVIYLLRQACDALREAHMAGLIHRDLKPPNIFASYRGGRFDVAKLLDFGLVKVTREEESPILTREGMITGSPLYMAPEQVMRTHTPDERTDIYALGGVAYFLLTGRPPFVADDAMAIMVAQARDEVQPPSKFRSDLPDDLERVVLRCLEKDPMLRYQDAEELLRALGACSDANAWTDERAASWWRDYQPLSTEPLAGSFAGETVASSSSDDQPGPTIGASELEAINPTGTLDPATELGSRSMNIDLTRKIDQDRAASPLAGPVFESRRPSSLAYG